MEVHYSSNRHDWETPQDLFDGAPIMGAMDTKGREINIGRRD